jgi:hypothetical protein
LKHFCIVFWTFFWTQDVTCGYFIIDFVLRWDWWINECTGAWWNWMMYERVGLKIAVRLANGNWKKDPLESQSLTNWGRKNLRMDNWRCRFREKLRTLVLWSESNFSFYCEEITWFCINLFQILFKKNIWLSMGSIYYYLY